MSFKIAEDYFALFKIYKIRKSNFCSDKKKEKKSLKQIFV